ncbi:hypothetical protein POTOM_016717 [Populus tomentosa]|uniref:Uncharacterized protein n=1 Tax=Populus tomentosa TaxID=118781 RepID=A0A8X7ZWC2_POPTO|nr:hypothetical protein POTOM_016717 [Populus tomentosa]
MAEDLHVVMVQKLDIPSENIQYLKVSYLLQQPFKQFASNRSADWITVDVVVHWVVEIAQAHDVSLKVFSPYSALTAAFMWLYIILLEMARKGSGPHLKGSMEIMLQEYQMRKGLLRFLMFVKHWPYVLGRNKILPSSGLRMRWEPQMETLWHPSIRGYLFHSVWGTVIEASQFGHCLVVLPFTIDQPLNARLLVEKDLAVEADRNGDGSFSRPMLWSSYGV